MPIPVKNLIISWRTLALSLLLSLAAGLSAIAEPVDRILESAVGRVAWRSVSGDTVVVGLDDKTLQAVKNKDFDVSHHAQLVDAIGASPAKRLFVDFSYERRLEDRDFPLLADAVQKMDDRIVLAVPGSSTTGTTAVVDYWPDPAFGSRAQQACICWEYEFWQVWKVPLAVTASGRLLPSFAAKLADRQPDRPEVFALDLSYDADTITEYSAIDVMTGKLDPDLLRGKDVIFAFTAAASPDKHYLPGHDKLPGAYIHLIAGEALKRGQPVDLGWIPALVFASIILLGALTLQGGRWYSRIAAAGSISDVSSKNPRAVCAWARLGASSSARSPNRRASA